MMTFYVIMHNMIVVDEGENTARGLELENMSDPIQLSNQNSAMFDYVSKCINKSSIKQLMSSLRKIRLSICGHLKGTIRTYVRVEFKFELFCFKTFLDCNIYI